MNATRIQARLDEIDARWEKVVKAAMKMQEPAGDYSRRGNWRSGLQNEAIGRRVAEGIHESATAVLRRGVEQRLVRLAETDPRLAHVKAILEEGYRLRQALAPELEV